MKYFYNTTLFLFLLIVFAKSPQAQTRTKANIGANWEFKIDDTNVAWSKVSIPHTAKIEPLVIVNQYQGVFHYQKQLDVKISKNQKAFLYFEGVMMEADVFVNDQKVANHKGGYLPFSVDVTPYVNNKQPLNISLRVSNLDNAEIPPGKPLKDLDFNFYGGIYRNVYLITTHKLHITDAVYANKKGSGGVFVNFHKVAKDEAIGSVKVHLQNGFSKAKKLRLKYTITNKLNREIEILSPEYLVAAKSDLEINKEITIGDPDLWSINNPNLYQLKIEVLENGKSVDQISERFGIRKSEIRADGYYLNDEKLYINGTNRHQEYPYLGYAISDEAQYRDAVKIKNAGFDMVRLSHYAQAEAFLKACDELGILVMNSLAGWQFFGNETFQENALQNIREMVRRDRNHPSIGFWENSLNETEMSESFMQKSNLVLDEEFPYDNKISACWIDNPLYDLFIPARQHGKAPEYWNNYNKGNRKVFIAEYGDWEYYAQNAGFNQKDFANLNEEERTSRQFRAFGEKRLLQQAYNFQEASNSNRKGKNTIGEANWLMFDYNRGYSPDIESSGISDIFRIPKFAFYFYQSQRDAEVKLDQKLQSGPMVKIASYYTENSPLEIRVYSNCDEVALYQNNVLIAKQKPTTNQNSDQLAHPPFTFTLEKYDAGKLKAIGFINNETVVESEISSPEKAKKIELSYDLSNVPINPEFPDVIFIYAKIVDENGTIIPDASNEITFELRGGNAELVGQNPIQAEAGIATILLRTENFKTSLEITAKAATLASDSITIKP